jgi:hypothetical protein
MACRWLAAWTGTRYDHNSQQASHLQAIKDTFSCNDRTGQDETIPQIRLFDSGSEVGIVLSQCCSKLSLKIEGTREDARRRYCTGCPTTKRNISVRERIWQENKCVSRKNKRKMGPF